MRRFILLILLFCSLAQAATIRWYGSFESALQASRDKKKPMFVVLVKRGCEECKELFVKTLMKERIIRLVNERTVPVIVTKENEDYPIELLYTLLYPAIFLLSPEEVLLKPPLTGLVDEQLLEKEFFDE